MNMNMYNKLIGLAVLLILVGAGCQTEDTKVSEDAKDTEDTKVAEVAETKVAEDSKDTEDVEDDVGDTEDTKAVGDSNGSNTQSAGSKTYTMAQVSSANTDSNCLTVVNGNVYDLTAFVYKHPGGDRNILKICGLDGTSAFTNKHGGQETQETVLAGFQVGVLVK